MHEVGADGLLARWPQAGPAVVASGYRSVQALPLTWHGQTFGALTVFRADPSGFEHQQPGRRALADAVTLLVVSAHVDHDQFAVGQRSALDDHALVELAKGALVHTRSLDVAEAFDALVALADEGGSTVGVAARQVRYRARSRTLDARPSAS